MQVMPNLPPLQNPYEASTILDTPHFSSAKRDSYGGIGRLSYFGLTLLVAITYQALAGAIRFYVQVEYVAFTVLPILVIYAGALMYLSPRETSTWALVLGGVLEFLFLIKHFSGCLMPYLPGGLCGSQETDTLAVVVLSILLCLRSRDHFDIFRNCFTDLRHATNCSSFAWFSRTRIDRMNAFGLALGALFFAASLTPSLLPRPVAIQGLLSGLALSAGYGLGVAVVLLWKYLQLPTASDLVQKIKVRLALAVGVVFALASLWKAAQWQNLIRGSWAWRT